MHCPGAGLGAGEGVGTGVGVGAGAGPDVVVEAEQLLAHCWMHAENADVGLDGHKFMQLERLPPGQFLERDSRKTS